MMRQIEINTINSFRLAKRDIIKLQDMITDISRAQEQIVQALENLSDKENQLYQRINKFDKKSNKKRIVRSRKNNQNNVKKYLASKRTILNVEFFAPFRS
jgi:uncharacterized protein YlxW (UPF0749 family)